MADQLRPGTVGEAATDPAITGGNPDDPRMLTHQVSGAFTPLPAFHGRAVSWVAVAAITIAFVVGGLPVRAASYASTRGQPFLPRARAYADPG